jgi:hypothetical protein
MAESPSDCDPKDTITNERARNRREDRSTDRRGGLRRGTAASLSSSALLLGMTFLSAHPGDLPGYGVASARSSFRSASSGSPSTRTCDLAIIRSHYRTMPVMTEHSV